MQTLDWIMIGGYFTLLLGVAWWVVHKSKDTAADYFLAGRNLSWWIVGASIFASNIGSEHVVGLAGSGAKDGVAMAHYELHAWCLLMLAWVFVPFYARSLVFTMPEFLERRFSTSSRYVLSIVSLITFVVSKIAVGIFAGGIVFSTLLPDVQIPMGPDRVIDSFWIGSILVILLTGLYTVLGGMRAVAYNDAIQTIVLIFGSATLTIYGLLLLGDWQGLGVGWHNLREACGSDMFNLWKPLIPKGVEGTWRQCSTRTRRAMSFARRGTSMIISPGWPWRSVRGSSASGTGVPTSTSCSGPWVRRTSRRPAAAASSLPSSSCFPFTCSSFPV